MKIFLLDTAYPDFLSSLYFNPAGSYASGLQAVLNESFGTSDFWSTNLRALGHECVDVVANYQALQLQWACEHGWGNSGDTSLQSIALEQIKTFAPDVVFLQDLSFFDPATLRMLSDRYLLAGQCSCPWPGDDHVRHFGALLTSFPHYVARFKALGVPRVEYMPLAFEPRMLKECGRTERDIDICFVGGVGRQSHWLSGTDTLEAVAARFKKRFRWYGYGLENLSPSSPLRDCWWGSAWGREMYSLYGRSKIVITRHGEVASGFTNNLRVFESCGMGALLMTEASPNLDGLFPRGTVVPYRSADELCDNLESYLKDDLRRKAIAKAGQTHALRNHTYAHRMKQVSEVLTECLERRGVSA